MRANALKTLTGLLLLGVLGEASARARPAHARDFSLGSPFPHRQKLHPRVDVVPIEGPEEGAGAGAAAGAGEGPGSGVGTGVGGETGTGVGGQVGTGKDPNAGDTAETGQFAGGGEDPSQGFTPSLRGGGDSPPPKRVKPNSPPAGATDDESAAVANAEAANNLKGKGMLDNMQNNIDSNAASVDNNYEDAIQSYFVDKTSMTNFDFNVQFPEGTHGGPFFEERGIDMTGSTDISKIEIWGVPQAKVQANPDGYLSVFSMYVGKNPSGEGWAILDRTYRSSSDDTFLGPSIDSWYDNVAVDQRIKMSDHLVKQFQATLPNTKCIVIGTKNIANQDTADLLQVYEEDYGADPAYWDASGGGMNIDDDSWIEDFRTMAQSSGGSIAVFAKTDYQGETMFNGIQPRGIALWYSPTIYNDPIVEGISLNDIYTAVVFSP